MPPGFRGHYHIQKPIYCTGGLVGDGLVGLGVVGLGLVGFVGDGFVGFIGVVGLGLVGFVGDGFVGFIGVVGLGLAGLVGEGLVGYGVLGVVGVFLGFLLDGVVSVAVVTCTELFFVITEWFLAVTKPKVDIPAAKIKMCFFIFELFNGLYI